MTDYGSLIPVNVLTGFLGSGKTTLLRRLLSSPSLSGTAVLVNEFGEVGLDHHLVQHVAETTLLLDNGCVCCAIRGDLQQSLRELYSRCERGEIPALERLVIETSGLADPVPIAYTVLSEPVIQHHFRLGNVVTTLDTVNARRQLDRFTESMKQVALADRIVLTKTDLGTLEQVQALRARLAHINPAAPVLDAASETLDADELLREDVYDADARCEEVKRWLDGAASAREVTGVVAHAHSDGVESFCLSFDEPLDWTAFGIWMTMLLNRHGDRVLRIKGMLNVDGLNGPVLVNGAQHIVHPPSHLDRWPDAERRSQLVFIVHGLEPELVERSLMTFNCLSNPTLRDSRPRDIAI